MAILPLDTRVKERYTIIRVIGKGGMGAVYEARDTTLDTTVALKQTLIDDEQHSQLFQREAKLLANLSHPGIPHVKDFFANQHGHFLVMEYVQGDNLKDLLTRNQTPFSQMQVLEWAHELMATLEYLHSRTPPVIHRDIKPANLILSRDNRLILIDFGLARATAEGRSVFAYTAAYAPPEQILSRGTDQQSDIYSLAATLYTLATNRLPANAQDRLAAIASGAADPLIPPQQINSTLSPAFSAAVLEAMQLDKAQRTASVAALRANLRAVLDSSNTIMPAPTTFAPEPEPPPRTMFVSLSRNLRSCTLYVSFAVVGLFMVYIFFNTTLLGAPPTATFSPAATTAPLPAATSAPVAAEATAPPLGEEPPPAAKEPEEPVVGETADEPTATTLPPTATPLPPTATPLPPTATPDLRARFPGAQVQQILDAAGGNYSVVVADLRAPDVPIYASNERVVFTAASLIKLPIALTAYQLAAAGAVNLDQQITLTAADIVGGTGSLQYEAPGSSYTLRALIARMIAESDNTAANMVIREIGGLERINTVLGAAGLTDTTAGRLLMDFEAAAQGRDNRTSAADMAQVLQLIYNGAIPGANEILAAMQQHADRQKIPALLPPAAVLGNKTGVLPVGTSGGAEHDAAIIQMPDGRAYSIVIMGQNINDNQTTINAISQAGRVIYDSLLIP